LMTNHQQQGPVGEAHLHEAAHGQVCDLPPRRWLQPIVAGQHAAV
jgi:hypothetical protein